MLKGVEFLFVIDHSPHIY